MMVAAHLVQEYAGYTDCLKDQDRNPQRVMTQMNHIKSADGNKEECG